MEINNETIKTYSLIILSIISIGAISYNLVSTGEEIVCRTNKPYGWDIIAEHDGYYEAVCPYLTKEPLYANCSGFRSTASYERYGCDEVALVMIDGKPSQEKDLNIQVSSQVICTRGKGCEPR